MAVHIYICGVLLLYVSMVTGHKQVVETEEVENPENPLRSREFTEDKGHIAEHTKGKVKLDLENASDGDLAFQFFSSHDTNDDGQLDGLEFYHSLEHGVLEHIAKIEQKDYSRETKDRQIKAMYSNLERAVDRILREDDKDEDGYLSYMEYSKARVAAHALKAPKN